LPTMPEPVLRIQERLTFAVEELIWAAQQIPTGRQHVIPLPVFGEWSVARIVFHISWYDANVILPIASAWPNSADIPSDTADETQAWEASQQSVMALIDTIQADHQQIIAVVRERSPEQLQTMAQTSWGEVTLSWVLHHLYQTLLEHTNTLLSMGLYWDQYLAMQKQIRSEQRDKNEPGWTPPQETT